VTVNAAATVRTLRYYWAHTAVQLDLPFLRASQPVPEPTATPPSIDFVRTRRARRYIIRVRPDGSVRVTVPRGGSRVEAARFLQKHAAWIAQERKRVTAAHVTSSWPNGATTMLRGEPVTIRVEEDEESGLRTARYGERCVAIPAGATDLRPVIEADLRLLAREELGPRLLAFAAAHNQTDAGLTIRNQQARWGSCSRSGRIALNYRLVQMPPSVRDYVLLHELMHLAQQNHSRRFWRLVEAACPDFRDAERWLKVHGRGLL
jgi:predicted metal-dependent hydrolase